MNGPITTEETYHVSNILKHYAHARKKHPYFCDDLLPKLEREEMRRHTQNVLTSIRKNIESRARAGHVGWDNLLNCKVWEVLDALANDDKAHAVEECYDWEIVEGYCGTRTFAERQSKFNQEGGEE